MAKDDIRTLGPTKEEILAAQTQAARAADSHLGGFLNEDGKPRIVLPSSAKKGLSPETVEQLVRTTQERENTPLPRKDEPPPAPTEEELERERAVNEAGEAFAYDDMITQLIGSEETKNPFLDPIMRKKVEASLKPLDLGELLFGRAKQDVPILPGKVSVIFQAIKGGETLLIESILREYADESFRFYTQMNLVLLLAVGVVRIDAFGERQTLPPLEDGAGRVTKATIMARYNVLVDYPADTLSLLSVHYMWFDERIRKAMTSESIKNG